MARKPNPLMVGERTAADLFDLKPADFLRGVRLGFFPEPVDVCGFKRWSFEQLNAIANGNAARPDGGLEL